MKKIFMSTLVILLIFTFVGISSAQEFPNEPIKLIVPWAPGGGTDTLARALAKPAEEIFDVPVVVENVEGGMGAVGLQRVKNSEPNGYQLIVASGYVGWMDQIRDFPVNFDDFSKVMALNSDPAGLSVSADSDWNNLEEFVEYAKDNPGEVTIGHSGEGMIWHIAGARVEDYFDLDFNYIPYGGASPAIAAVMGGDINAVTVGAAEVASQVEAGDLRILGVMGEERLEPLPEAPTFKEMGHDINVYTHRGLVGPKGIPKERVEKLYEGFSEAMEDQEFIKTMNNLGLGIKNLSPEEYDEFIEEQSGQALDLLKDLDMVN